MRSLICGVILAISLTAFHRSHGELLETEFPGTPEEVETPEDEGMLTIFGKITDEDPPVHDWVKATAEEVTVAEKLAEAIDDDDIDSEIARALNVLQSEDMDRFARATTRYTQPYPQAYKTPDYPPTSYKADTYRGNTYTTQQYQIPSYQEPTEEVEYEEAPPTYQEAAEEYPEQVPDESYTGEYGEDSYQPEHYEEEGYVEPEQPAYPEEAYPEGTYTEENYPPAETDEPYAPDTYTEDPYQEQEETYPAPPAYPDKPPYPGYPPKITYPSRPVYPSQPDYVPQPAYPPKPIYQLKPYPVDQYRDDGYGTAEKSGSKGSKRYKGSGSKRSKGSKSKEKKGYKGRKSVEKKGYKKSGSRERKRYSKEGKGKSGSRSREKGYKGLRSGEKGGYKRSGSKERKRYSKEKKGKSGSKSKEKRYKKRKSGEKKGYKGSKSNEGYNVYTQKPEYRGGDQKDYRYQSGPVYGKYQPTYKGRAGDMQDTDGVYEQDYQAPPPPKKSYPKPQQYPARPPKAYPSAGYSGNPCNDKRDQNKCNGYGVTLAWYYDGKARTCRAYFDKGCKQSKNIFKERVDCSKKCGGDQKPDNYYAEAQKRYGLLGPSTCLHPRSAGNGREQYLSWYFDRETLYCKPFVFSGYFGNANRYDSREQCIQVCSVHMKPKSSYATKTYPPAAPPPAAVYPPVAKPAGLVRG